MHIRRMAMRSSPMPKAKPEYLVGVNAAAFQHLGMDHAGAQELNPALAVAGGADLAVHLTSAVAFVALHVHLAAGLGEGEVVGTEADHRILAVEPLAPAVSKAALQVAHGDALVYHQALHLVEHGGVGGVDLILPVDPARGQTMRMGGCMRSMVADLHGAGLGPQQDGVVVREVEGVAAGHGKGDPPECSAW